MSNFRVGQKVVFIGNGDFSSKEHQGNWIPLKKNTIYTVRNFAPAVEGELLEGIRVEEVINGLTKDGIERAYWAEEFRPLIDISIFTKMLEPNYKPQYEDDGICV